MNERVESFAPVNVNPPNTHAHLSHTHASYLLVGFGSVLISLYVPFKFSFQRAHVGRDRPKTKKKINIRHRIKESDKNFKGRKQLYAKYKILCICMRVCSLHILFFLDSSSCRHQPVPFLGPSNRPPLPVSPTGSCTTRLSVVARSLSLSK